MSDNIFVLNLHTLHLLQHLFHLGHAILLIDPKAHFVQILF